MTPSGAELLATCVAALTTTSKGNSDNAFAASRMRSVAWVIDFAAQDLASGAAVRVWENAAIRALLIDATDRYGSSFLPTQAICDDDLSIAALDEGNAELRRLLIELHAAVEDASDLPLDRRILDFYIESARRRELAFPAPLKR